MTLNFPQKMEIGDDQEVALLNCFIPYSWFNLTPTFANQSVSYFWPPSGTTHLVTFPTAYFLTTDISSYIQQVMVANGHYLINNLGANVYYLSIVSNYTIYGNSLIVTVLPSSLPVGWTLPAGFSGTLSAPNARTPQLIFNNSNFGALIGFAKTTSYPATPQTTTQIINSPLIPQLSPVIGCFITTNLVNAPNFNTFGDVIYAFTPTVQFGQTITIEPTQSIWYPCTGGSYDQLQVVFTDSLHNPLGVSDSNIVCTLMIRQRK